MRVLHPTEAPTSIRGVSPTWKLSSTGCVDPSDHLPGPRCKVARAAGMEAAHQPITWTSPALAGLQAQPKPVKTKVNSCAAGRRVRTHQQPRGH